MFTLNLDFTNCAKDPKQTLYPHLMGIDCDFPHLVVNISRKVFDRLTNNPFITSDNMNLVTKTVSCYGIIFKLVSEQSDELSYLTTPDGEDALGVLTFKEED